MSVDHDPVTYFGWPITHDDLLAVAGEISRDDEPSVVAATKLDCAVRDGGNAWTGRREWFLCVMHKPAPWTVEEVQAGTSRVAAVQAKAATFGIRLGAPKIDSAVVTY